MKQIKNKTERIHSLDSLRAIMMLLGLVLHSALTYNVTNHGDAWEIKDPKSNLIFTDFIVLLIHSFRMPIFFLVAGFFGSMLFYERGAIQMFRNRISRIVFPFIIFLFILSPLIYFSFNYTITVFENQENPFVNSTQLFSNIFVFIPKGTSHLWFLYYLIYITLSTSLLGLLLKKSKNICNKITNIFNWIIKRSITRIALFSSFTFLILTYLETSMVNTSTSLIPDLNTFVFYLFFYIVGWLLFKSKGLLNSFMKYDWQFVAFAVLLVITQGLLIQYSGINLKPNANSVILISFNSIIVWLFIFGITGLFIRFGSKHSEKMRYISDSSYWVYLIHLPLIVIIPAFISEFPLPALVKFIIVLSLTTLICFATYHYLVRNTFIGKFLNGKKYPRKSKKKPVANTV